MAERIDMNEQRSDKQDWGASDRDDPWSAVLQKVAERRDRGAFRLLFDHFSPQIKAYLMKGIASYADRSQAEEMTQEVMIKVWN